VPTLSTNAAGFAAGLPLLPLASAINRTRSIVTVLKFGERVPAIPTVRRCSNDRASFGLHTTYKDIQQNEYHGSQMLVRIEHSPPHFSEQSPHLDQPLICWCTGHALVPQVLMDVIAGHGAPRWALSVMTDLSLIFEPVPQVLVQSLYVPHKETLQSMGQECELHTRCIA
jgi:hypothetical protein